MLTFLPSSILCYCIGVVIPPNRQGTQPCGAYTPVAMKFPNSRYRRCHRMCWAHHVCHPGKWLTIHVSCCSSIHRLPFVCPRGCEELQFRPTFRMMLTLLHGIQQHEILFNQVQAPEDAAGQQACTLPSTQNSTTPATDVAQPQVPLPATAPPRPTGPTFFQLLICHLCSDPQACLCTSSLVSHG